MSKGKFICVYITEKCGKITHKDFRISEKGHRTTQLVVTDFVNKQILRNLVLNSELPVKIEINEEMLEV